jgi:hypothetical protein
MRSTAQRDAIRAKHEAEATKQAKATAKIITPAQKLLYRTLKVLGLKQNELARFFGTGQQSISKWKDGVAPIPLLVLERCRWMLAKQDALNVADGLTVDEIQWCKKGEKMTPPMFLDHLPYCGDCQAAVLKAAGYF